MLLATVAAQNAEWKLAQGGSMADRTSFYVEPPPADFSFDEPMKIPIRRLCEPMKIGSHLGGEPMKLPPTALFSMNFICVPQGVPQEAPNALPNLAKQELLTADRLLAVDGMTASFKKAAKEADNGDEGHDFSSQETQSPFNDSNSEPHSIDQSITPLELPPTNEGSRGHPDFCSRPCLYFAAGTCFNGESCHFCHIPHDKRTVHLDKRNRASLHSLDFANRLDLVLPAILERARHLGVADSLEHRFAEVKRLMDNSKTSGEHAAPRKLVANERGKLKSVLKGLRVQELFKMLKHPSAPPSVQLSIDILHCEMQDLVLKTITGALEETDQTRLSEDESQTSNDN